MEQNHQSKNVETVHSPSNTQYLDILPKLVKEYKNTKRSSPKMTPVDASKKKSESLVWGCNVEDEKRETRTHERCRHIPFH